MDKKTKDMSYREVHKKLEDAMQDAFTSDEAGPFGSPEIDYSFMDDTKEKKKRKISGMSRFNKVAAIIIIVLLGMNVVMMATGSSVSYSEKGLLHRIYEGARGIFTDEDESEYVEIDETGEVCTIHDFSMINDAKRFWPDLYVPDYIPSNFTMSTLDIKKEISGDYWAKYVFFNENSQIKIEEVQSNDNSKLTSGNEVDFIVMNDRKIVLYTDNVEGYYLADVFFDDVTVYIYGDLLSMDELCKIATELKQ